MSAYCSNCGSALSSASRFCSVCGTAVNGYASGYAGYPPQSFPPYVPRLVRPLFGRQFAGVCIGLARTYGWDVGLVRIIAVLAGIFTFPIAEVAYVACWIGIPEEEPGVPQTGPAPSSSAQSTGQPY
jgi:phage shock protein C